MTTDYYRIVVNNETNNSHNINLTMPCYECSAMNKEEAVGKMMLSDFWAKNKPIVKISKYTSKGYVEIYTCPVYAKAIKRAKELLQKVMNQRNQLTRTHEA